MNILLVGRSGLAQTIWNELTKDGHQVTVLCRSDGFNLRMKEDDMRDWLRDNIGDGTENALIIPAGVQGTISSSDNMTTDEVADCMNVNLLAVHKLIVQLWTAFDHSKRVKMILFSGGGSTTARPNFMPYAISKTALVRMVECMAEEWREQNHKIDINAIAPGQQLTGMTREVIEAGPKLAGQKEYDAAMKTLREPPSTEPMMKLIRWLLSSDSDGVSGNLLAALWDDIAHIKENLERNKNFYKLRRIMP